MNKIVKIFLTIIVLFIIFLITYLSPRDYVLEYKKNKVNITERFQKEKGYYDISLKYKNKNYEYIVFEDYSTNRKLIDNVSVIEFDDYTCLLPESKSFKTYPLCKQDNNNVSYHLIDGLEKKIASSFYSNIESLDLKYKNIEINALNDKTFLIWNYSGLDIISKSGNKTINIFERDVYDTSLAYLLNDYFIIPNYESDYYFDSVYIYNLINEDLAHWDLGKSIYFDSYVLGKAEKSLFLFDIKNKKEYELVPHKKKIRTISPRILINGEWENISVQKLINNKISFSDNEVIKYTIVDNKLYKVQGDYKELISNQNVKNIVSYNSNEVYYLVDDSLYLYTIDYGEVKLMTFFEWNFNFENKIFVY